MSDRKSVRFRQDQVSVFNGNNCPLSAGFSVRNHRNTHTAFIEANLTDSNLSVDQLAQCVSLSKVQTYRKIKAISGLSIVEFIRTIRLKKAAQLILENRLTFSEISFETGFSTPSYFSKCFHDHFGQTPSEFAASNGGR